MRSELSSCPPSPRLPASPSASPRPPLPVASEPLQQVHRAFGPIDCDDQCLLQLPRPSAVSRAAHDPRSTIVARANAGPDRSADRAADRAAKLVPGKLQVWRGQALPTQVFLPAASGAAVTRMNGRLPILVYGTSTLFLVDFSPLCHPSTHLYATPTRTVSNALPGRPMHDTAMRLGC